LSGSDADEEAACLQTARTTLNLNLELIEEACQLIVSAIQGGALLYASDVAVRRVWRALGFRSA
jgi:hypothetical protein